ncbi:hypothetical protein ACSBR1_033434 [Camellia fascicularis]
MLQETCRSGSSSAGFRFGFRFLQYYIHLGRLDWIGSTSHFTFARCYTQRRVLYARDWSIQELVPSTRDIPYEFVAEENSIPLQRVRYCRHCKAYVKGFDHHWPAFGNCIGQKNRVLFIILLVGFVFTEASYVACSSQCKLEYIGY